VQIFGSKISIMVYLYPNPKIWLGLRGQKRLILNQFKEFVCKYIHKKTRQWQLENGAANHKHSSFGCRKFVYFGLLAKVTDLSFDTPYRPTTYRILEQTTSKFSDKEKSFW